MNAHIWSAYICIYKDVYLPYCKLVGSSMNTQPSLLSPSRILPPSATHCSFMSAKKNSEFVSNNVIISNLLLPGKCLSWRVFIFTHLLPPFFSGQKLFRRFVQTCISTPYEMWTSKCKCFIVSFRTNVKVRRSSGLT